jgi:hypothetical protein
MQAKMNRTVGNSQSVDKRVKIIQSPSGKGISRRTFLKSASAAMAAATLPGFPATINPPKKRDKMILTFYMDDTNPEIVKAQAFKFFLDYCDAYGIKGESSLILGYSGESITDDPGDNDKFYVWQAKQAYEKGIDSHMEIMTHDTLFDFRNGKKNESGIHEGLWLHEPAVMADEYEKYFASVIAEGEKSGLKFTGLTWPGCSCPVCTKRYAELRSQGPLHFNPAVFETLLNLSRQGKFRTRVIPIFYESSETDYGIFRRAADGKFGVYDLMPNCKDHFGIWENSIDHVDPDYYISKDGKSGIIIRHLTENAPYCMWYMHWQGVNPENGKGWSAFHTVTERIRKHLADKVIWMRPTDIAKAYHDAGGWGFTRDL